MSEKAWNGIMLVLFIFLMCLGFGSLVGANYGWVNGVGAFTLPFGAIMSMLAFGVATVSGDEK